MTIARERLAKLGQSTVVRRLAGGAIANLLGKFWVLVVQMVSIPVLATGWGAHGYGVWLMLTIIPTYILLSDLGLSSAGGVEITKKIAADDHSGAREAFQSVWVVSTLASIVLIAAFSGFGVYLIAMGDPQPDRFGGQMLGMAVIFCALYSFFAVQMLVLNIVFRATHKYALGTFLLDLLIPVEGIAVIGIALAGGAIVEVAAAILLTRLVGFGLYAIILFRYEPWLRLGWASASATSLRGLVAPSLAAFSLTLSNALMLQGVVFALGVTLGPGSVAVFSAARILARVPLQFSGLVSRASIPELTRTHFSENSHLNKRIGRLNVYVALICMLPFVPGLGIWGPELLLRISGGTLHASNDLFFLLILAATFNAVWSAAASPLMATNRQDRFSYHYVALCAVTALAPFVPYFQSLTLTASVQVLAEAIMLLVIVLVLRRQERGV